MIFDESGFAKKGEASAGVARQWNGRLGKVDISFAQAMDKLVEHFSILLPESTIRRITEHHAQQIFDSHAPQASWPQQPGCDTVIAEREGGMVPIVEPDPSQADQRKGKCLQWKEAKLCLAHSQGSRTLAYGGTLQGDVNQAGQALFDCAIRKGFGQLGECRLPAGKIASHPSLAIASTISLISTTTVIPCPPLPKPYIPMMTKPLPGWTPRRPT